MMISVTEYRSVIGTFLSVAQKRQKLSEVGKGIDMTESYDCDTHLLHICAKVLTHMIASIAGIYEYVAYCILRLKLVVLANNIETNPGPEFSLAVQGSFSQGALKYGEVAGSQCSVIALFA